MLKTMKPNELEIKISGTVNSGKSTVAQIIQEALAAHGITMVAVDPDYDANFRFTPEQLKARAAEIARKGTSIRMFQEQVRRSRPQIVNGEGQAE